jgi:glyoxylase-like metal-dependent hydrolase (beta-lactamase superfamily II)
VCSTFEAPFIYLFIGSSKALLIDTGDVADPEKMPLANTVMGLLPGEGSSKLPLIVVHTHRHMDHRAGDPQFEHLAGVQLVPAPVEDVRKFFGFNDWPNAVAEVDLGDRTVDVMPVPGHNAAHVAYYDRATGLFLSGDFFLPGRLLIEDTDADVASAKRVATFLEKRPVSYVLGAHIEKDAQGALFPWESTHHPHERPLQMTKEELLALPPALDKFNGFYTQYNGLVLQNSLHILLAMAAGLIIVVTAAIVLLVRFVRRRRRVARDSRARNNRE